MDILCLMGFFPENYRKEIERDTVRGMKDDAADKLQQAIVKGLSNIEDVEVSIANSLFVGAYPERYRRLMIPDFEFTAFDKVKGRNIGFCNLMGFKYFSRFCTAKKTVEAWARKPSADKVLLIYALTNPFTQIAEYIKKKYKNIRVCIVVPDLPEHMRQDRPKESLLKRFLKRVSVYGIRRNIRQVDCYVLLTDAMNEWFEYPVRYTVVEGIAAGLNHTLTSGAREKMILYAGAINEAYGVIDLVKSFLRAAQNDWNLVLYGDGIGMQAVKKLAEGHPNVKIMGTAPNQEVVLAQRKASVLVNPRKNQIFTKYSFPSKILEYMSSGTAMLAYKLDGVPEEYDPFYYQIPEEENGMELALRRVMQLPEEDLRNMGERARRFVAENKNPTNQCRKIMKLLTQI